MKTITEPPNDAMFRTSALRGAPPIGVDRVNKRINGAAVIQLGAINDSRPYLVDQETLEQVVDFGNQSNRGLKARFSHPNMSNDGMGRHLGQWTNFRVDGEFVRADLQLTDTSFNTPHGNLGGYVLDIADESPEMFGVSLATAFDDEAMDELEETEDGRRPLRFSKLKAADFVDEPAATRTGLFSNQDIRDLPEQATWLLDSYFSDATPDVIRQRFEAFLSAYFRSKGIEMSEDVKKPDTTPDPEPKTPEVAVDPAPEQQFSADDVKAEERARIRKINALCDLANCPDKAQKFIDADFTVDETKEALSAIVEKQNAAIDSGEEETEKIADPDEKFRQEFRQHANTRTKLGLTEDDYVRSRRIDEGLEPLVPLVPSAN